MNWYKTAQPYGYHGTDPTVIESIKRNGLPIGSFFASNEDDISPYTDGVWLRFPFPEKYEQRVARGDYYTTLENIFPVQIEIKTDLWDDYKKL